jgi:hypothetical protein
MEVKAVVFYGESRNNEAQKAGDLRSVDRGLRLQVSSCNPTRQAQMANLSRAIGRRARDADAC